MINPTSITNFKRTDKELEQFFVFCWFSKAANAKQLGVKINNLFDHLDDACEDMDLNLSPFGQLNYCLQSDLLKSLLEEFKVGKYEAFIKAFSSFGRLNLRTCSIEDVENIPGIGKKIARMFLLHSRHNQRYVCLDTHLMKEARKIGATDQITAPHGQKYLDIEEKMIKFLTDRYKYVDFAKFDLDCWKSYS